MEIALVDGAHVDGALGRGGADGQGTWAGEKADGQDTWAGERANGHGTLEGVGDRARGLEGWGLGPWP